MMCVWKVCGKGTNANHPPNAIAQRSGGGGVVPTITQANGHRYSIHELSNYKMRIRSVDVNH